MSIHILLQPILLLLQGIETLHEFSSESWGTGTRLMAMAMSIRLYSVSGCEFRQVSYHTGRRPASAFKVSRVSDKYSVANVQRAIPRDMSLNDFSLLARFY